MRIKKLISLILSYAMAMSSMVGHAEAARDGGTSTHGPAVTRNAPIVSTPEQHRFCNNLGRQLGISQYAGRNPDYSPLINEVSSSRFGSMGAERIRQMLISMNRALNREDVIGSLFRANSECLVKLHQAGLSGMANEVGASRGGIKAAGEDAAKNEEAQRLNQSIADQCSDVNLSDPGCDTDQSNQSEATALAQNGQQITNTLSGYAGDGRGAAVEPTVCECATMIVTSNPEKSALVDSTKAQLTQLIQDRLNEKFLNNYAQNREDLQFLTAHRGDVFGSSKIEQDRNAESLICNSSAEFQSYVNSQCASKVSQEELNLRQQELFGKLSSLGPSSSASLESHWQNLENQIKSMPFPTGATVPSGHRAFDRSVFDRIRNGLSYNEPVVSTLGKFLSNLINSDDFKNSTFVKKTPRPYENIRAYLASLKTRPDFANIKSILTKDTPENFLAEFENDPSVSFDNVMGPATGIHPGIRIALSEGKVFQKLLEKGGDALKAIDNDKSVLFDQHLKDSCNRIKHDYANALCNRQADLIASVNNKDMDDLLANQNLGISIDVAKHIICTTPKKKDDILDLHISEPPSSLLSRIKGEKDFMGEIMEKFIDPENDSLRKYLADVTTTFDSSSRPIASTIVQSQNGYSPSSGSGSSILDYISEDGSVSNTRQTNNSTLASNSQPATEATAASASTTDTRAETSESTSRQADVNTFTGSSNYSASALSNSRSPASEAEGARNQLSDSISSPENRAAVQEMVSQVDDEQIRELTRLRDEARRSADKMAELTSRTQLDRIKALEDQIKQIESQRQTAIAQTLTPEPTPAQRALVPASEFSVARSVSEIPGRDIASVAQAQVGGVGGGSSVLGNLQTTLSSALNGNLKPSGSSEVSPLLITSNVVKVTSPDLSQEVLRFLETEPDLSSLNQIKERGLLYRFKIVRDGKEVIEEVLIQFERLSPQAKAALEAKIARRKGTNPAIERLETELASVKRTHSYESLRFIIGQQAQRSL